MSTEHERLDARANREAAGVIVAPALALHQARLGDDKVRAHAIVIAERGAAGAGEQHAALGVLEERLQEAGHFWGSDANAIVVVGGEECEHAVPDMGAGGGLGAARTRSPTRSCASTPAPSLGAAAMISS